MCLDFRALNEATVKDAYPLPLIDVLFDQLAGKRVFSSLDLRSGYLQMKVDEDSVQKLSFRSPFGSYAYKVVPLVPATHLQLFPECWIMCSRL